MRTNNEVLIAAMHILSNEVKSTDGVANAAIQEAACRLEEMVECVKELHNAYASEIALGGIPYNSVDIFQAWDKVKEVFDDSIEWPDWRSDPV